MKSIEDWAKEALELEKNLPKEREASFLLGYHEGFKTVVTLLTMRLLDDEGLTSMVKTLEDLT